MWELQRKARIALKKRRKKEKSQSTAVVDAAKWQAAEAWREAKQSCVGSTAVVDAVKWQGAIKQRRGSQECAVAARPRPCQCMVECRRHPFQDFGAAMPVGGYRE